MPDVRSVLAVPAVYRLFTNVLIGRRRLDETTVRLLGAAPGDRVLDIGCGPGDFLHHLRGVDYHGIDLSPEYITAARRRWGDHGTFRCEAVADTVVREPHSFDAVVANGLLHHLDDAEAVQLFEVARRSLKPGGRFVTMDGCFAADQSRAARFFLRRDRGRFVRTEAGYLELARAVFPSAEAHVRHGLIRLPYTHIFLVCRPNLT